MANRPKVVLDPSCVWQPDMDAAAQAALQRIPSGSDTENAGVLFRDANGNYCYSTTAPGGRDSFDLSATVPVGTKLAGTYHNHPAGSQWETGDSRLFSPNDVQVARQLNVPSFVRAEKDGVVRRYTPGTTKTKAERRQGRIYETSEGDVLQAMLPAAIAAALRGEK